MNIRLDESSMRVRLQYDEAVELSKKGLFAESLCLGSGKLEVNINVQSQGSLSFQSPHGNKLEISVPQTELESLIAATSGGMRSSKSACEIRKSFVIDGRSMGLRFEIDQFRGRPNRGEI